MICPLSPLHVDGYNVAIDMQEGTLYLFSVNFLDENLKNMPFLIKRKAVLTILQME
jgi:hypothetical protein